MINNRGYLLEELKCIGGPMDGKWANIGEGDRVGYCIKVMGEQKLYSVTDSIQEMVSAITVDYHEYMIDCFHFAKDDVHYFLRPVGWTSKKAIQHQFRK